MLTGPCSDAVVTDDLHVTQVIKLVPVTRDTDGSCTTEDYSQDWFIEGLQEIKEEPKDVCYCLYTTVCPPQN